MDIPTVQSEKDIPNKDPANQEAKQDPQSNIYDVIKTAKITNIKNHQSPPFITKLYWDTLGTQLSSNEKKNLNVPKNKTYTLRLDITGMSTKKKLLVKHNIFTDKYSELFATIMQKVAYALGEKFHAKYVYTQSDEITLVIPPPQDSPNFEHIYGGRHDKLISLSASHASAVATQQILLEIMKKNLNLESYDKFTFTIEFDSRLAVYENESDAFQLILWRAYDCGVNGVSDAIYNISKKDVSLNTLDKLKLLEEKNLLPLPGHQAYGTMFRRSKILKKAFNPITKEEIECMRSVLEKLDSGNIINKYKDDKLDIKMF